MILLVYNLDLSSNHAIFVYFDLEVTLLRVIPTIIIKMYIWTYILYIRTIYLTYILTFYLAYILASYLTYVLAFYLAVYLTYIFWHSIWQSIWHIFWHGIWHNLAFYLAFYLTFYLAFYLTFYLAFYLAYILTFYLTFYVAFYLAFYLAVEVQQCPRCPLRSGGPWLRSSGAQWAREVPSWGPALPAGLESFPVEVQQCPLISGDVCWGPAAPTGIGSWQLRSSSAHCDQELARRRGGEEEKEEEKLRRAMLKSNNSHLAGGEKCDLTWFAQGRLAQMWTKTVVPSRCDFHIYFCLQKGTCLYTAKHIGIELE